MCENTRTYHGKVGKYDTMYFDPLGYLSNESLWQPPGTSNPGFHWNTHPVVWSPASALRSRSLTLPERCPESQAGPTEISVTSMEYGNHPSIIPKNLSMHVKMGFFVFQKHLELDVPLNFLYKIGKKTWFSLKSLKLSCFCSSPSRNFWGFRIPPNFRLVTSVGFQVTPKTAPPTGDLDLAPWLNEGTRWAPKKTSSFNGVMYRAPSWLGL